jgi:hypothetical protein
VASLKRLTSPNVGLGAPCRPWRHLNQDRPLPLQRLLLAKRSNRNAGCSGACSAETDAHCRACPATFATKRTATLEAGQFADDASAKASCPTDTVVWVNLPSKIYHFAGTKNYGTTNRGVYMCEKVAIVGENRASKTETHP